MRLASFDVVTAVAVVGAIDAVQDQDTVMPWLDLSQAVPEPSEVDLTELDFAELIALEIDPAPQPAEFADIDLDGLDLEQLLAMRTDTANEPLAGIAAAAMEELMQVDIDATIDGATPTPFDLTDLDLDVLQELRFGEEAPLPETPYLRIAALDLSGLLGPDTEHAEALFNREPAPISIATSDYAVAPIARIENPTADAPAIIQDVVKAIDPPGGPMPIIMPPSIPPGSPPISPPSDPPSIPFNRPPTPFDDLLEMEQGSTLAGNVLANDSDPDGDPLSIASIGLIDTVEMGAVEIAADGQFTYAPPDGFHGTDSFMYSVMDTHGAEASATVTIDVIKTNSAPVARDDLFIGTTGSILSGNVLDNDEDPDGDTLTVTSTGLLTTDQGGTLQMRADGTFDYKPPAAFTATDSVVYSVEDGHGGTADAILAFEIDGPAGTQNGTAGDDRLVGNAGNDTIRGGAGNDLLVGLAGADDLEGGDGVDTASYEASDVGVEVDLNIGEGLGGHAEGDVLSGIENLIGSDGDDFLHGETGSNVLLGLAGNDLLMGDAGDDILDGGLGIDALLGGDGNDVFVVGPGTGSDLDVIADFTIGADVIDLRGFGLSGMSDLSITADFIGSTVTLPSGDSISLLLVDPAALSPDSFIF